MEGEHGPVSFCGIPEPKINQTDNLLRFQRATRRKCERGRPPGGSNVTRYLPDQSTLSTSHGPEFSGSQTGAKEEADLRTA